MRRMMMIVFCAFALMFGLLDSGQVHAATEEKEEVKMSDIHGHKHFKHNPEFLIKQAESLGIKTEGKDTETIFNRS